MGLEDSHTTGSGLGTLWGLCTVEMQERPPLKMATSNCHLLTSETRCGTGQAQCLGKTRPPCLSSRHVSGGSGVSEEPISAQRVEGKSCEREV